MLHHRGGRNPVRGWCDQICDEGQGFSCPAEIRDGLAAIRIEGLGGMAIVEWDVMFESSETFAATWALRQFAHQPMLQRDRPNTNPRRVRASGEAIIRFSRFCALPRARRLLADGQPVELGSRAFDLLMVLIGAPGVLITKKEIVSRVWPDTVVEESNLKVQMSALRKVLNTDRDVIKTVHGRGYVFTGEVTTTPVKPDSLDRPGSEPISLQLAPAPSNCSSDLSSPRRQWATGSRIIASNGMPQPVVVLIDDDPNIRDALRAVLRAARLCVDSFASVQEFLDSDPPALPGCLVLDVSLPGQSGLEFQEELTKANLRLPIIFISGYADVPMSVRAMKRGAVEFLTKPVHGQDLLAAIQLAIAHDRADRDAEQSVRQACVPAAPCRRCVSRIPRAARQTMPRTGTEEDRAVCLAPPATITREPKLMCVR